jgi:CheY-specific phosphatase CheX
MSSPKDPRTTRLTVTTEERARFLKNLIDRSTKFLQEEASILVQTVVQTLDSINTLEIESITSILTVEDFHKTIVAFSYQRPLLEGIFMKYAEGLKVSPEEYSSFLEETAGDMINIVIGNALADFQRPGMAFNLSTPIIINEAKSIFRYKKSELITARLSTELGSMLIICVTPGAYYDRQLNIEVSE